MNKTKRKYREWRIEAQSAIGEHMASIGLEVPNVRERLCVAEKLLGLPTILGAPHVDRLRLICEKFGILEKINSPKAPKAKAIQSGERVDRSAEYRDTTMAEPETLAAFYASWEWKVARYEAIKLHGRKCLCCGAGPDAGVSIVVDHIKPLRMRWDLRLAPSNLQVLCDDCNRGKSFRDETDWRPR